MVTTRNIRKSLAVVEDIAVGRGTVLQKRGEGTEVDLHIAVESVEALADIDTAKYTRARVYNGATYVDYVHLDTQWQPLVDNTTLALKIFQSPTDSGLTEIQTRTVEAGEVYEVRKTSNNSLATIYSDAAGTTEIVQNGTSNVSDSAGVIEFYIADGDYYVEVGGVPSGVSVSNLKQFNTALSMTTSSYLSKFQEGTEISWAGYYNVFDGGGNRGVLKFGTHTGDGGSIFRIDSNTYIEAEISNKTLNPSMFGAKNIDTFSSNEQIKNMIAASGEYGKMEITDGVFIVNERISLLEGQEVTFKGWLKLDTLGDTSVSGVLDIGSAPNCILRNPMLDGNREGNATKPGSGSFGTLSANKRANHNGKIYGGIIKNGLHNNIQASAGGLVVDGTVFENSGEHCVYLNNIGNVRGDSKGIRFNNCKFKNVGLDPTGSHSEAHYVQARNIEGAEFNSCEASGMGGNMNGSAFNLTECKGVKVNNGNYGSINHFGLIDDSDCEDVTYTNVTFARDDAVLNASSMCRSQGSNVGFNSCKFLGGWAQTTLSASLGFDDCEIEMIGRFSAIDHQKYNNCRLRLLDGYSASVGIARATADGGGFSFIDSEIYGDATTGIYVTSEMGAGASSKLRIDGLIMPDFTGSNMVVTNVGDSAVIKGVETGSTGSGIIKLADLGGKSVVSNCILPNGGYSITNCVAIEGLNITSATI